LAVALDWSLLTCSWTRALASGLWPAYSTNGLALAVVAEVESCCCPDLDDEALDER
jgi:hypothetical protein